ncbi:MAG TPA: glutamine--tRNA ligase/YqeY domain fusion protein [Tissierellia bacterium]|nr:glutamine--tRNA ligase/YqeY domain fusion protein [Tissierellia bacterium]
MREKEASNFIRNIIIDDLEAGKYDQAITRFPPEPNGLLHIGHAKAITINFDMAKEFGGYTYLRFDDTNPEKEDERFVRLIQEDIEWLGFTPHEVRYASDYFGEMYQRAHILIDKGLAYVDDTPAEEMAAQRGDFTTPGIESKHRNRPIEESKALFEQMKAGEFDEGELVLRAKIDMASPNMVMRDPVIYRIVNEPHYRTGDEWHIYPMYDFAHPLEDYMERITHSLCSLEFENNRPLYDWYIEHTEVEHQPHQYEFAKLQLTNTIIGKRFILKLVADGIVDGWDDPRLLTISGMRRRGFRPEGIKDFIRATGVSKENSLVDIRQLEFFIREDLKLVAPRINAVLDPLKVTIINHPGETEMLEFDLNPENPDMGKVLLPFSNEVYIERDDFEEEPPKGYKRLSPGVEVRLRGAYFIKLEEIVKDEQGHITELKCSYDPATKSGSGFKDRKPQGTIHWVDGKEHVKASVKRYDLLVPDEYDHKEDGYEGLNLDSIHRYDALIDISAKAAKPYDRFQFIRHGYFSVDPKYPDELTFNETVSLKSSYRG